MAVPAAEASESKVLGAINLVGFGEQWTPAEDHVAQALLDDVQDTNTTVTPPA